MRRSASTVRAFPCVKSRSIWTRHMRHHRYYEPHDLAGKAIQMPRTPFGLSVVASGRRTASAEGADAAVRHTRARFQLGDRRSDRRRATLPRWARRSSRSKRPGRGDPGRESGTAYGARASKKSIVLDLKKPQAVEYVQGACRKVQHPDRDYATGVMDRLGLGAEALKTVNRISSISPHRGWGGQGRTHRAVAYGTLLQCYAGFAGLNRHPRDRATHRPGVARSHVWPDAGFCRCRRALASAA